METQTKHDKAIFLLRMIFIVELDRIFVEKYGLGFFKGNTVFPLISTILPWIPLEPNHTYNIFTSYADVKSGLTTVRQRTPHSTKNAASAA